MSAPPALAACGAQPRAGAGGLDGSRRSWAAFTIALAVIISVLDGVMLTVALPTIAQRLGTSPATAIWAVNAYQIAVVLMLLPLGKLADTIGHRRVYLGALMLFTFGSLGCALSRDIVSLSLCRFVQGCGGAGMMGLTNAMLRLVHPPELLGRGIGTNSLVVALSLAAAPSISSAVIQYATWQWLFLINLPIGATLLLIGTRTLPTTSRSGRALDGLRALPAVLPLVLLIFGITLVAHDPSSPIALGIVLAGAVLSFAAVRTQLGLPDPLLPLDLLRNRMFGMSIATIFCSSAAQVMAYVALPFLFLRTLGRSQIETGLLFLPWPLALAIVAPVSGRLSGRFPASLQCAAGMALFAAGLASLTMLGTDTTNWGIGWRMALCGIGYGIFQPPNSRAIISSAPLSRSGSASVMGAAGRVSGQAAGAAIIACIFRLEGAHGPIAALVAAAVIATIAVFVSLSRATSGPAAGRR